MGGTKPDFVANSADHVVVLMTVMTTLCFLLGQAEGDRHMGKEDWSHNMERAWVPE